VRLSIRNQFDATIVGVAHGQVMSVVKARLAGDEDPAHDRPIRAAAASQVDGLPAGS
jgi:hypothetical protein